MEPRDFHIVNRVGLVGVARLLSNIISPPVMFACLALALALYELPLWSGLAWAAAYGFFVSLAPILFIVFLLRSGHIQELHMSNIQERHLPYLAAILGTALVLGLLQLFDGPHLLRCLALFNLFTLAALVLLNRRWLVSFHATGATALAVISGLVFGLAAGLGLLPVVVLIVGIRLYLKRHTWLEVVAGIILPVVVAVALTLLGCFV